MKQGRSGRTPSPNWSYEPVAMIGTLAFRIKENKQSLSSVSPRLSGTMMPMQMIGRPRVREPIKNVGRFVNCSEQALSKEQGPSPYRCLARLIIVEARVRFWRYAVVTLSKNYRRRASNEDENSTY